MDRYFSCPYCQKDHDFLSFHKSVILFGIIFLVGKDYSYIGFICPDCRQTVLIKLSFDDLKNIKESLSPKEGFYAEVYEERVEHGEFSKDLQIDGLPLIKVSRSNEKRKNSKKPVAKFIYRLQELYYRPNFPYQFGLSKTSVSIIPEQEIMAIVNPEDVVENFQKYISPYLPRTTSIGDLIIPKIEYDKIQELLTYENNFKATVFPRYYYKNSIQSNCHIFCSNYYDHFSSSQKSSVKMNYEFIDILENGHDYEQFKIDINDDTFHLRPKIIKDEINTVSKKFETIWSSIKDNSIQDILAQKSYEFNYTYYKMIQKKYFCDEMLWDLKNQIIDSIYNAIESPDYKKELLNQTPKEIIQEANLIKKNINGSIVGTNFKLLQAINRIHRLVNSKKSAINILLLGETGTGKEVFAKACHDLSNREGPFIPVNCGAIQKSVFESQLFGYKKGSFTDAKRDSKGAFVSAQGGTLFLDEIGELDLDMQDKLLRVISEREVQTVGASRPKKVDVMLIMATNVDLLHAVKKGYFRSDLYYRCKGKTINIPPLRERTGDIPLLLSHFVNYFDYDRKENEDLQELKFSNECLAFLTNYHWGGNVRELISVVENIVDDRIYAQDRTEINKKDVLVYLIIEDNEEERIPEDNQTITAQTKKRANNNQNYFPDEDYIDALEKFNGVRSHAAKYLGVLPATVFKRIRQMKEKGLYVPPAP